jgi:hypothetical protein
MTEILGDDYPFFFKTKEEFLGLLDKVEDYKDKDFKWDIPDYDEIFKNNLISSMEECIVGDLNSPKDATRWIHCILNGYQHKQEITNQVQPNMGLNSVWQYIRRWLLVNGVVDDPNCEITKYSIPDDCVDKLKSLTDGLDFQLKPNTTKQKTITNKNHGFF